MSERDYDRCDRECEKLFAEKRQEALIVAEAEVLASEEFDRRIREQERMKLRAKRKQAYREGCWAASFASGAFLVLCLVYIHFQILAGALFSGFCCVMFGLTCAFLEPMAYGYCGKRVKK